MAASSAAAFRAFDAPSARNTAHKARATATRELWPVMALANPPTAQRQPAMRYNLAARLAEAAGFGRGKVVMVCVG